MLFNILKEGNKKTLRVNYTVPPQYINSTKIIYLWSQLMNHHRDDSHIFSLVITEQKRYDAQYTPWEGELNTPPLTLSPLPSLPRAALGGTGCALVHTHTC